MLRQRNPRLRRSNVVLNSFSSCISNASEEFSRAPEMSFSEVIPQPRMLLHQLESRVPLEQLKSFANRHCWWQFNKQMDVVNSDMKLVNFTSMFESNFSNEPLAINFKPIKFKGVHCIFNFPHKVEGILPEGMFKTLQIHFFTPELVTRNIAHANSIYLIHEPDKARYTNKLQELNLVEEGNSSLGLKAEVSLPLM